MRAAVIVLLVLGLSALAYGVGYRQGLRTEPAPFRSVEVAEDLPRTGTAARVRGVLLEPDVLVREAELAALLQELGPESLEDVRAAYDSVFLDLGEIDLILLAEWWARFDAIGAFAWTKEDWRAEHPRVAQAVLHAWARIDPEAALDQALEPDEIPLRRAYLHAVLAGWDESGQPGLEEYVQAMPPGHDRQRAIYVLARRKVLHLGVDGAFRWAEGFSDSLGVYKLNVFRRVASSAAEVEPEAAADWAERHMNGDFGHMLLERVGTRWAKRDPSAAMRWLATVEPGQARADALQETYRTWMRLDREASRAWMREAEPESWLDPARSLYALGYALEDPPKGVELAGLISGEELRLPTIGLIVREWLLIDEPAAMAWLDQADIPEKWKAGIQIIPKSTRRKHEIRTGKRPRLGQRAARPAAGPDGG